MEPITALIIDDEAHNRKILRRLLAKHCAEIEVTGEADSASSAYEFISREKPQLLFLDIKMRGKSGFDLLRMFDAISFEVIFVSAFNEYAITAFDFNALAYILKPIDFTKLTAAVSKAIRKIRSNEADDAIFHFIQTVEEKDDLITKISVHHGNNVVLVNISDVISIASTDDNVEIRTVHDGRFFSTKGIKLFERLLDFQKGFVRISRGVIINTNFIVSYSKGEVCILEMPGGRSFEVSRRKKAEVLSKLCLI